MSWFCALRKAALASEDEIRLEEKYGELLMTVENTSMSRCYKMVILQALLEHRALRDGLSLDELADYFRDFYRKHPIARMEMSNPDLEKLEQSNHKKLRALLLEMPIGHWEQDCFKFNKNEDRWSCVKHP